MACRRSGLAGRTPFDGDKPVVLKGAITKVDWRNPHIWVYLDVREADGTVTKPAYWIGRTDRSWRSW